MTLPNLSVTRRCPRCRRTGPHDRGRQATARGHRTRPEGSQRRHRRARAWETARLPSSTPGAALPPSVVEAMTRGDKIDAIRLLREQTGLGLKEAKDAVEAGHQVAGASLRTHSPGLARRGPKGQRRTCLGGGAPGDRGRDLLLRSLTARHCESDPHGRRTSRSSRNRLHRAVGARHAPGEALLRQRVRLAVQRLRPHLCRHSEERRRGRRHASGFVGLSGRAAGHPLLQGSPRRPSPACVRRADGSRKRRSSSQEAAAFTLRTRAGTNWQCGPRNDRFRPRAGASVTAWTRCGRLRPL